MAKKLSRSGSYFHARTVLPHKSETLGYRGLAVRRNLDPRQLDDVFDVFRALRQVATTSTTRGEAGQFSPALVQLEKGEAKRQPGLQMVDAIEAKNILYDAVRTIRRPLYIKLGKAMIIGRHGPLKSVALGFEPDYLATIHEERGEIIETLEGLVEDEYADIHFDWNHRGIPHLSIGQIPTNTPKKYQNQILEAVTEASPEGLSFDRATLD